MRTEVDTASSTLDAMVPRISAVASVAAGIASGNTSFESVFQTASFGSAQRTDVRADGHKEVHKSAQAQERQRPEVTKRSETMRAEQRNTSQQRQLERQRTGSLVRNLQESGSADNSSCTDATGNTADVSSEDGNTATTQHEGDTQADATSTASAKDNDALQLAQEEDTSQVVAVSVCGIPPLVPEAEQTQHLPQHVLSEMAKLFGIEQQQLESQLHKLGLTQQQLANPTNYAAVMAAVLGLEHEAQLLNVQGVALMHSQLVQVLAQVQTQQQALAQDIAQQGAPTTESLAQQALAMEEILPQTPQAAQTEPQPEQTTQEDQTQQELPHTRVQQANAHTDQELGQQTAQDRGTAYAQPQKLADEPHLELVQQSDGSVAVTETSTNQAARVVSVGVRPASQNVNASDVVRQLADNMRFDLRGGNVSEVRLTLRPENLGEVSMKIASENGIVTASFVAENSRVKEVIEANLQQLRQALQEKGIEVSQLSVSVDSGADERMRQFLAEQARTAARLRRISGTVANEGAEAQTNVVSNVPRVGSTVEFSA